MEQIDMEGFDEEDKEEDAEESAEDLVEESEEADEKPVIRKTRIPVKKNAPIAKQSNPLPAKKKENRYQHFRIAAREGIADTYTNKVYEDIWEVLADISSKLDRIERSLG